VRGGAGEEEQEGDEELAEERGPGRNGTGEITGGHGEAAEDGECELGGTTEPGMEEVSVEFMKEADSVDGEGEIADGGGDMGRAAQEEGEKEGEMDERKEWKMA
jgi:hypothetical protein